MNLHLCYLLPHYFEWVRIDGVVDNASSCFPNQFLLIFAEIQSNSIQRAGSIFEWLLMIECWTVPFSCRYQYLGCLWTRIVFISCTLWWSTACCFKLNKLTKIIIFTLYHSFSPCIFCVLGIYICITKCYCK